MDILKSLIKKITLDYDFMFILTGTNKPLITRACNPYSTPLSVTIIVSRYPFNLLIPLFVAIH